MIPIELLGEVTLTHRARTVAIAESGHVAAASNQGEGTYLAPGLGMACTFRLPANAGDLALSADGGLLATTARGRMALKETATFRPVHSLDDSVECVCFTGGALWSAKWWSGNSIVVEVREPAAGKVVAQAELTDPFGGSCFRIMKHPQADRAVIWAAAGQDGQCLFWAHREGAKIRIERFGGLDSTSLPSFSKSGDRFLAIAGYEELRLYDFPAGHLRGSMRWPGYDQMEHQTGDWVWFIDAQRAVMTSLDERLYLVDVEKMALVDEIAVGTDMRHIGPAPGGGFLSARHDGKGVRLVTWRLPL